MIKQYLEVLLKLLKRPGHLFMIVGLFFILLGGAGTFGGIELIDGMEMIFVYLGAGGLVLGGIMTWITNLLNKKNESDKS